MTFAGLRVSLVYDFRWSMTFAGLRLSWSMTLKTASSNCGAVRALDNVREGFAPFSSWGSEFRFCYVSNTCQVFSVMLSAQFLDGPNAKFSVFRWSLMPSPQFVEGPNAKFSMF